VKKLLVITDDLRVGGREKIIVDLCNHYKVEDYQVTLVSLSKDRNPLQERLMPYVRFEVLPFTVKQISGVNGVINFFTVVKALKNFIIQNNPEIIHTHATVERLLLINLAIKRSEVKAVQFQTIHTAGMHYSNKDLLSKFRLRIEKAALKLTRPYLIAVSPFIQQNNKQLFASCSRGSRHIPNGINMDIFQPAAYPHFKKTLIGFNEDDIVVAYVAQMRPGKNHTTLLKAMKYLLGLPAAEKIRICLIGGSESGVGEQVKQYAADNKLMPYVTFMGNINNVAEILSACDIGVFPSEFEGFSLSLLEMMAMELPVVTSDIPIFRELIAADINGYTVPVMDFKALADKLLLLASDPALRRRLGKGALETASQYSLDAILKMHDTYYTQAIASK